MPLRYDFVVVARTASADAEFTDLQTTIAEIFQTLQK
jgi:RNase P protein component